MAPLAQQVMAQPGAQVSPVTLALQVLWEPQGRRETLATLVRQVLKATQEMRAEMGPLVAPAQKICDIGANGDTGGTGGTGGTGCNGASASCPAGNEPFACGANGCHHRPVLASRLPNVQPLSGQHLLSLGRDRAGLYTMSGRNCVADCGRELLRDSRRQLLSCMPGMRSRPVLAGRCVVVQRM
ncbi:hypothetical protein WJX75_009974 [Coccomyxa subellipsoidea]|uniref:Uncharacterized protein n=1 Tax=Coccomyxa subellipsoidea TaxID=248742 RepID=A0ABR2YTN0_9CHLO